MPNARKMPRISYRMDSLRSIKRSTPLRKRALLKDGSGGL